MFLFSSHFFFRFGCIFWKRNDYARKSRQNMIHFKSNTKKRQKIVWECDMKQSILKSIYSSVQIKTVRMNGGGSKIQKKTTVVVPVLFPNGDCVFPIHIIPSPLVRTTKRSFASRCFDLSGCHSRDNDRYLFVMTFVSGLVEPYDS